MVRTKAMVGSHEQSGEDCSNCGTTYAACTKRVFDKRSSRPCCGSCGYTDTHDVRAVPPEPEPQPLQWRISDDEQAVIVWPADLPGIAKQEAFEVTISKDMLVVLWERLDRRHYGFDDDRTGGL